MPAVMTLSLSLKLQFWFFATVCMSMSDITKIHLTETSYIVFKNHFVLLSGSHKGIHFCNQLYFVDLMISPHILVWCIMIILTFMLYSNADLFCHWQSDHRCLQCTAQHTVSGLAYINWHMVSGRWYETGWNLVKRWKGVSRGYTAH